MEMFIGFQPQRARQLICRLAGALRLATRSLQRCQLLWRKLAHGRVEADTLAIAFDCLDNLGGQRAAAVIVIPKQACHDHRVRSSHNVHLF